MILFFQRDEGDYLNLMASETWKKGLGGQPWRRKEESQMNRAIERERDRAKLVSFMFSRLEIRGSIYSTGKIYGSDENNIHL